jgi:hypothetical protein
VVYAAHIGLRFVWLGGRDSNPDSQIQSLESYHWTTSQQRIRMYVSLPTDVKPRVHQCFFARMRECGRNPNRTLRKKKFLR